MVCSPEQLAANQRNAQLSTGPTSVEGKQKSRQNGFKHGLTGQGIVIPHEDTDELDDLFAAFEQDLKPTTGLARQLTRKAAFLSIRLDRAAREDAARLTLMMHQAAFDEEDAHYLEIDRLASLINNNPAEAVRKLRRSPEGIDRLILSWQDIREVLVDPEVGLWSGIDAQLLMGQQPLYSRTRRVIVLTRALGCNFSWLEPTDWPDLPDLERKEAARAELIAIIDGQIAELRAAREAIDHEMLAVVRAGAASRAIFQVTKAAILARKYEAADERNFQKALKQIAELNAAAAKQERMAEETTVAENPLTETASDEMGSSFSEPDHEPEMVESEPIRESRRPTLPVESRKSRRQRGRLKRSGT